DRIAVGRRQTMNRQLSEVDEIMDRSNNTLLHIEANNKALGHNASLPDAPKVFNVQPESEMALVKILDNFKQLVQNSQQKEQTYNALDECLAHRHRVEHLGSSVRKLVALVETVGQMRSYQEGQDGQEADEDSS
ncbi:hypothetical protein KR018_012204, partial [Drosophila ironensis]